MVLAFNIASASFAAFAALFWLISTVAEVKEMPPGGTGNPEMLVNGKPLVATLLLQAKWNKRAATMAAIASIFQAATFFI
ncbi:hypothetical protein [Stenotrophomonas maltophilia]|uniref:hypothetical protein n=1 Tax=Stenotrophomonas maltophilia TaxID=40324 RepID=UPI0039C0C0D6